MNVRSTYYFFSILLAAMLVYSATSSSATGEQRESHKTLSGVVTKGAGGLAIKSPQGTTYQVNETRLSVTDMIP